MDLPADDAVSSVVLEAALRAPLGRGGRAGGFDSMLIKPMVRVNNKHQVDERPKSKGEKARHSPGDSKLVIINNSDPHLL